MNITSFLIYCVIVTFTPGPTNIVILSTVNNSGTKKALEYVWGATIAFGILLSASTILNSILVAVVPKILNIMQIIGCFYMLYLAYGIYKGDKSEEPVKQATTFMSGFLMQFVNPKVVVFTMTVIPSFVMPYYASSFALSMFIILVTAIGFLAFVTWVLFGKIFKRFLQKYQRTANIIMALFLAYSAIMVSGVMEFFKVGL